MKAPVHGVAKVAVLASATSKGPWTPLKPDEVPEKVKHPDVMAHLVEGSKVQVEGDTRWFTGVVEHSPIAVVTSQLPPGVQ